MILNLDTGLRDGRTVVVQADYDLGGNMTALKTDMFDLKEPAERVRLAKEFGKLSNRPDLYENR